MKMWTRTFVFKVPVSAALLFVSTPAFARKPVPYTVLEKLEEKAENIVSDSKITIGAEADLSRDTVTPSTFPIVSLGYKADSKTRYNTGRATEYNIDMRFRISPNHPKAYALTGPNLYFGESDDSANTGLRFTFGRRLIGWSKIDDLWDIGEFEPLDSWDRLRSTPNGLTGIFAYADTDNEEIRLFASYLFLPEMTPNIVIDNNRFSSEHPQAVASAPQTYTLLNRPTPLGYNLAIPSIDKIIFRPSFAVSAGNKEVNRSTHEKNRFRYKLTYGYLPYNYFPIALQATLAIPLDQIVVSLQPRLLSHHLMGAETSFKFAESATFGFAALGSLPVQDTIPADYTTTTLTNSVTLSPWLELKFSRANLVFSQIITRGGLDADVGPYADPNSSIFSSRLLYRNASEMKARYLLSSTSAKSDYIEAKYLHEYSINADWISADLVVYLEKNFSFLVGGDLINADKTVDDDRGAEFLADVRAIDRVRMGVQYVF
ncbi:MAG: hypothetical protein JST80_11615 [Bdellovibrionales bacterium]|nr:hypothetical protein [Bdellovibrionales bacterium]